MKRMWTKQEIQSMSSGVEAGNGINISEGVISVDTDVIADIDYVDNSVTGLVATSEMEEYVADNTVASLAGKTGTITIGTGLSMSSAKQLSLDSSYRVTTSEFNNLSDSVDTLTTEVDDHEDRITVIEDGYVQDVSQVGNILGLVFNNGNTYSYTPTVYRHRIRIAYTGTNDWYIWYDLYNNNSTVINSINNLYQYGHLGDTVTHNCAGNKSNTFIYAFEIDQTTSILTYYLNGGTTGTQALYTDCTITDSVQAM